VGLVLTDRDGLPPGESSRAGQRCAADRNFRDGTGTLRVALEALADSTLGLSFREADRAMRFSRVVGPRRARRSEFPRQVRRAVK
jgi:hypothetical protein